jgi:hypothetical protein
MTPLLNWSFFEVTTTTWNSHTGTLRRPHAFVPPSRRNSVCLMFCATSAADTPYGSPCNMPIALLRTYASERTEAAYADPAVRTPIASAAIAEFTRFIAHLTVEQLNHLTNPRTAPCSRSICLLGSWRRRLGRSIVRNSAWTSGNRGSRLTPSLIGIKAAGDFRRHCFFSAILQAEILHDREISHVRIYFLPLRAIKRAAQEISDW